jgi:hypothetical protein
MHPTRSAPRTSLPFLWEFGGDMQRETLERRAIRDAPIEASVVLRRVVTCDGERPTRTREGAQECEFERYTGIIPAYHFMAFGTHETLIPSPRYVDSG